MPMALAMEVAGMNSRASAVRRRIDLGVVVVVEVWARGRMRGRGIEGYKYCPFSRFLFFRAGSLIRSGCEGGGHGVMQG